MGRIEESQNGLLKGDPKAAKGCNPNTGECTSTYTFSKEVGYNQTRARESRGKQGTLIVNKNYDQLGSDFESSTRI